MGGVRRLLIWVVERGEFGCIERCLRAALRLHLGILIWKYWVVGWT